MLMTKIKLVNSSLFSFLSSAIALNIYILILQKECNIVENNHSRLTNVFLLKASEC